MTLDNLLSLIDGKLLSEPSITSFNAITDRLSRVQRGDLFVSIDQDQSSIDEALAKGAYGIIFDKLTPTLDNETAWIKVDSSFDAHLKLLRFHLMPKQLEVYYSDIYTLEYIAMMKTSTECKIISDDITDIATKLWHIHDGQKLLLKYQPEILTLFPMAKEIGVDTDMKLLALTPVESNLTIRSLHYDRLKIPEVLHPAFTKALSFLKSKHLHYQLSTLTFPKSFNLISCDNFFSIKEFGKGNLTLLFLEDEALAIDFLASVSRLTPWIHARLFLNKNLKNLSYNSCRIFEDQKALLEDLEKESFDVAVICGASSEILTQAHKPIQPSLF